MSKYTPAFIKEVEEAIKILNYGSSNKYKYVEAKDTLRDLANYHISNKNIISAAPEMLEALKEIVKSYGFVKGEGDHLGDHLINVISKAEGKPVK